MFHCLKNNNVLTYNCNRQTLIIVKYLFIDYRMCNIKQIMSILTINKYVPNISYNIQNTNTLFNNLCVYAIRMWKASILLASTNFMY